LQVESMKATMESEDVHTKIKRLIRAMVEQDDVLKEKFQKFLQDTPELKVAQSEEDKQKNDERM